LTGFLPSRDDPDWRHMGEALDVAREAASIGEVPIGAVVVRDGTVLARGHNRREVDRDPTAHAELLALRRAAEALGDWRLDRAVVYVTLEPCAMCAGAMVLARIAACVYACPDPKGGFLGTLGDLSQVAGLNHRFEVRSGVRADEASEMLRAFFRELRGAKEGAQ
jgi:tRNA(adenine34) deaminase